ncbi:hypothetical protein CsSME_00043500 [Camellia sinensis var. sinensis]
MLLGITFNQLCSNYLQWWDKNCCTIASFPTISCLCPSIGGLFKVVLKYEDKMSLWKRAHNLNDPDMVAIVEEYNTHLWKVLKEQHSIEYCDGIYHKIIGKDGHGYCKTYGRGVPWSAVYVRGSDLSQSSTAPSFMDEITRCVIQDVESRFTTTIENLTARVLFF